MNKRKNENLNLLKNRKILFDLDSFNIFDNLEIEYYDFKIDYNIFDNLENIEYINDYEEYINEYINLMIP